MSAPKITEPVWYRQPWELDFEWQGFQAFRSLPAHARSLPEVALLTGQTLDQVTYTSERCSWVARIKHFEEWENQRAAQIAGLTPNQMRVQRREILEQIREITTDGLGQLIDDAKRRKAKGSNLNPYTVRELAHMSKVFLENSRLESGEPTAIVQSDLDLSKLSVEELKTLRSLQSKAQKSDAPVVAAALEKK